MTKGTPKVRSCPFGVPAVQTTREEIERLTDELVTYIDTLHDLPERPLPDPDGRYRFAGIRQVRRIAALTGEKSINRTESRWHAAGTDLGFSANLGDTTYFFFGDTHTFHQRTAPYKHNAMAYTTDSDYTDGITLDGMLADENTNEFQEYVLTGVSGIPNEKSSIPGGAFALGDTLYVSFFSQNMPDPEDCWNINFSSFVKSTDHGITWERVPSLTWPGDCPFLQNCPQLIGDTVYLLGTGCYKGGRGNPIMLMRVKADRFEDFNAYEYLTGYDENGAPVFQQGREAMYQAVPLIDQGGELSAMYSEYLGEWLVINKTLSNQITIRSAPEIWGPYSAPVQLFPNRTLGHAYSPILNPRYVSEGGKKLGLLISLWWPVYNVHVFEIELMRKEIG